MVEINNNKTNCSLISVVVPLYNYKHFIKDCIKSVINQDYENYELIIVDDCSTDDSYKKAKKFENDKIRVIRLDKNCGYSKAKNEGIAASKGDYIVTLDADDMMTKNSLSVRIKAALKYNVDLVHADAILVKGVSLKDCYKIKDPSTKPHVYPRRLHCSTVYNIHAQSVLVLRDVYKKYGMYDEDLECRVDREMWWRLFGKTGDCLRISSYFVNKCVAYYRRQSKQVTRKKEKGRDPAFYKFNTKLCEEKYLIRKKGINSKNTRLLDK